jgi:hypothetical protein
MSVSIQIYNNVNNVTRTMTVDFNADVLATTANVSGTCYDYYFKFTPNANDTNNVQLPIKFVSTLSDLVLHGVAQKGNCSANAYSDISSMIVDYTLDYIEGHISNECSSGCTLQLPMKF